MHVSSVDAGCFCTKVMAKSVLLAQGRCAYALYVCVEVVPRWQREQREYRPSSVLAALSLACFTGSEWFAQLVETAFLLSRLFVFLRVLCPRRQINGGKDLPREFLEDMFTSIKENEIQVRHVGQVPPHR